MSPGTELRMHRLVLLSSGSLCFSCLDKHVTNHLPAPAVCRHAFPAMRTVELGVKILSFKLLLVMLFYHSDRKVPNTGGEG